MGTQYSLRDGMKKTFDWIDKQVKKMTKYLNLIRVKHC